jgi:ketosteroid isomerase-like protein
MAVSAAKKAARTKKRKSAAKKAAVTRKHRAAGRKAAKSRQQSSAGRAAAAAAIRATADPWCQAAIDRNWEAIIAMCTGDVVFAPPGQPSVSSSRLRSWLDSYPVIKAMKLSFDRIEVNGDLATGVGRGSLTVDLDGQDVSTVFKFTDVFRRDPKGWRYAHVMWNMDTPGA